MSSTWILQRSRLASARVTLMRVILHTLLILFILVLRSIAYGQETNEADSEIDTEVEATAPPSPHPPPQLKVRAGLRMELVADGHLVESPAALAFDEMGRLYVAELRDYPSTPNAAGLYGRVRLLEDADHDGVFDTSSVFADQLTLPSAVACSRGGVFVAGATELIYARDQDNDGIADLKRPLLNFTISPSPQHPWELPAGLTWGPDRRLHLTIPSRSAEVFNPNFSDPAPLKLTRSGLSFNPLTLEFRSEASTGATSMTFDEAGRPFFCTASAALAVGMLSQADLQRNPFAIPLPDAAELVGAQPGSTPMDALIYRGSQYSTNLQGQAFLADPERGTVYLVALGDGNTHPKALAQKKQMLLPLVTSSENTFRPMRLVVGPDDAIYIADFAREVYPGGPAQTLDSGAAQPGTAGRIWRLTGMANLSTAEVPQIPTNALSLTRSLGDSNSWVRATAARLLYERHATNATAALRGMLTRAKWSVARLEALRSLEASGALSTRDLSAALGDPDSAVRAAAMNMTQRRIRDGRIEDPLWYGLRSLAGSSNPELRLRDALALGAMRFPSPQVLMQSIYRQNAEDPWTQRAMLTTRPDDMAGVFIRLLSVPGIDVSHEGREVLLNLATSIGLAGRRGDVSDCLEAILDLDLEPGWAFPLATAFGQGVQGRGSRLALADENGYWIKFANSALNIATRAKDERIRAEAVRTMSVCIGPEYVADEYFLLMFAPGLPEPMQNPVIQTLAAQGLDRDFEALTQRWHLWQPPQQLATLNALLQSEAGTEALLRALADGQIPTEALTSVHINLLRSSPRADIRLRAERLFGREQPNRDALLSDSLRALELQGTQALGQNLFQTQCSYCHRSEGDGLGPSPGAMRNMSPLQLLAGLLDPSRNIDAAHATMVLRLSDGRTVWGVAEETNGEVITLKTDAGRRRYLGSAVVSSGRTDWSLMPDNMAAGLTLGQIADLEAFLRSPLNN